MDPVYGPLTESDQNAFDAAARRRNWIMLGAAIILVWLVTKKR